jgi:apolipoprotein N-acyltransferase
LSQRLPPAAELLLAAALGGLIGLPLTRTHAWPLSLLCIGLLYLRASISGPRRGAAIGGVAGTTWLASTVWWMYISMHDYGGLLAPLAALAVLLLSAALSVFLGAAFWTFCRLRCDRPGSDALLFAGCWLLAELARGVAFTGFPWSASGYTQVDSPLAALAPWVGVYGMGACAAWVGAACAAPWLRRDSWALPASAAAVLVLLAVSGPGSFTTSNGHLSVALLQTNVAQDEKFSAEGLPAELAWLALHLAASTAELTVTPETAVPLLPDQLQEADVRYWPDLASHFRDDEHAALVGLPLGDFEHGYTNSVAGLSRESATLPGGFHRYDKHHLVPFGEFVPQGFHWFVRMMAIPLGDFSRGPVVSTPFAVKAQRVAPNICYEDLFGEELAALFADDSRAPTVLANMSNIAWFGDTIAIEQHLNISRMRSLELQRPMLRATNTGATAIVDYTGRVSARLPAFTQGVLRGEVEGRFGLTPYARWASRAGLWPPLLLALLLCLPAVWRKPS